MNLKIERNGPYIGQYKVRNNKETIAYVHVEGDEKEVSFLSHRFKLEQLRQVVDFVDNLQIEDLVEIENA